MCRFTPSKDNGTGIGSSAVIAACFQASNCSLSSCGISRLQGLCCPSRKETLRTRVSTPRPTINGGLFVSIGILAFSPGIFRGACYLFRAQGWLPSANGGMGDPAAVADACRRQRPHPPAASPTPPSPQLTREDALPERASVQVVIQQEEVKDIATMPAGVAVPARRRGRTRRIDAKRGVSVPPVIVVPAKGAATHASPIKFDIAADYGKGVLHSAPLVYGHFKRGSKHGTRGAGVANDV